MLSSDPLKVLVVVPDIEIGGVTSSFKNFCRELIRNNNHVDVVVLDGNDVDLEGVTQIRLTGKASYWNLGKKDLLDASVPKKALLSLIGIIKKLSNLVGLWFPIIFNSIRLDSKYDVAVAYRQCAPCYYFTLRCVNAKKHIAMIHGNLHFMNETKTWDRYLGFFDCIACVSNAVEHDFRVRFNTIKEKFTTIYNMFDADYIRNKANNLCPFEIDETIINIVSVTRHENGHKKVNRIIESCALLHKRGVNNFHWYIVGDGPDFEHNKELAKSLKVTNYVTFCGAQENPFPIINKCDFLVHTSATEAYGMVIREAQILTKPAIAMEFDGVHEVILDGFDGIVVKQDTSLLCDELEYLINNPNRIKKLADNISGVSYGNVESYKQFLKTTY